MPKPSTFKATIRMISGTSFGVTIPKEVAELWGEGKDIQVTIEELEK